jgi:hypothetical protein
MESRVKNNRHYSTKVAAKSLHNWLAVEGCNKLTDSEIRLHNELFSCLEKEFALDPDSTFIGSLKIVSNYTVDNPAFKIFDNKLYNLTNSYEKEALRYENESKKRFEHPELIPDHSNVESGQFLKGLDDATLKKLLQLVEGRKTPLPNPNYSTNWDILMVNKFATIIEETDQYVIYSLRKPLNHHFIKLFIDENNKHNGIVTTSETTDAFNIKFKMNNN